MNLASLSIVFFVTSNCVTRPPDTEPCSIIDFQTGLCIPSNGDPEYDLPIQDMLGYVCLPPDDIAEWRAYIRKITDDGLVNKNFNRYMGIKNDQGYPK